MNGGWSKQLTCGAWFLCGAIATSVLLDTAWAEHLVTDLMERALRDKGFVQQGYTDATGDYGGTMDFHAGTIYCDKIQFAGGLDPSTMQSGDFGITTGSGVLLYPDQIPEELVVKIASGVYDFVGHATTTTDLAEALAWPPGSLVTCVELDDDDATKVYAQLESFRRQ